MEVNFFAAAELTRAVLPHMRRQGSGHILNLTSIGGLISIGGFGAYCAGKFALEAWADALRDEVKALGIRVTTVEPGNFRTEFAGDVNLRPDKQIDAYRPVIAPIEDFLYGQAGKQAGDPEQAAALMIEAVDSDAPPAHLIMGTDAYEVFDRMMRDRDAELKAWRSRGEATSFKDAAMIRIGAETP
jgi:short-subunit dehydrogenase